MKTRSKSGNNLLPHSYKLLSRLSRKLFLDSLSHFTCLLPVHCQVSPCKTQVCISRIILSPGRRTELSVIMKTRNCRHVTQGNAFKLKPCPRFRALRVTLVVKDHYLKANYLKGRLSIHTIKRSDVALLYSIPSFVKLHFSEVI